MSRTFPEGLPILIYMGDFQFMNKIVFIGTLLALIHIACTTANPANTESKREVSSAQACQDADQLSGIEKQKKFFFFHQNSMAGISSGGDTNLNYISDFIGGSLHRKEYAAHALAATGKFLAPNISDSFGYRSLKPTLQRDCEFFEAPEVKMVHALGTLAIGHMNLYAKLKALGPHDEITDKELPNPWTGVLQPLGNDGGVPLVLRFSIANPVGPTLEIGGKSLLLEFIPGLAIKFLMDHQKSIQLVAMESLAGQASDHNYFKYEFSPDFSAHAPADFNTAQGEEKKQILARYNYNPVNAHVMGLVGKRFFDVIPQAMKVNAADLDPHSNLGPHPFLINIQQLAAMDKKGNSVDPRSQKRPWRLTFKPALDNIETARLAKITDKSKYVPGNLATDFRSKLGHLQAGDRIYYVIGETSTKKRYVLGDIVLDSAASPSEFADKIYFIQHQLDTARALNPKAIADPQ
jgi:hypothetical protein